MKVKLNCFKMPSSIVDLTPLFVFPIFKAFNVHVLNIVQTSINAFFFVKTKKPALNQRKILSASTHFSDDDSN